MGRWSWKSNGACKNAINNVNGRCCVRDVCCNDIGCECAAGDAHGRTPATMGIPSSLSTLINDTLLKGYPDRQSRLFSTCMWQICPTYTLMQSNTHFKHTRNTHSQCTQTQSMHTNAQVPSWMWGQQLWTGHGNGRKGPISKCSMTGSSGVHGI